MSRRRIGRDAVLAVLLPALAAATLLAVRPVTGHGDPDAAPSTTALRTATLGCPAALPSTAETAADALGVTTVGSGGSGGQVAVGLGGTLTPVPVVAGQVAVAAPGAGAATVTGIDALAPGLVAGRSQAAPLAATDCTPPQGDQWFTGVGAGATHDSVVELVNPGTGTAAADVTVWSSTGPVEVDRLLGVSVPAGSATQLDLGQLAPRRGSLAVRVHVDRGELTADVVDTDVDLATGATVRDWLPAQAAPSRSALLLGLAAGSGERTLTLVNPGDDEVRATVQLVTATGVFAPAGVDPVRVPADSTASVSLSSLLADQVGQGAIGVLVTSSGAVAAGLRQVTGGDLSALAPTDALSSTGAAVLPAGTQRVLLAGATAAGTAQVTAYAADGSVLGRQTADLRPGVGADLTLPDGAGLVTVDPGGTGARGAVLVTSGTGTAVVGLRQPQLTGLVPSVRPGLP